MVEKLVLRIVKVSTGYTMFVYLCQNCDNLGK